jgi:hypothetical protein
MPVNALVAISSFTGNSGISRMIIDQATNIVISDVVVFAFHSQGEVFKVFEYQSFDQIIMHGNHQLQKKARGHLLARALGIELCDIRIQTVL